jgi:hypothetical protein
MSKTILLAGQPFIPTEKLCSEAITPGMLVEVVPSGGNAGKLRKHATASGNARAMFALESLVPPVPGSTSSDQIDVNYASGDSVRWAIGRPGDEFYALVPAAAAAIKDGDALVSNGDGTLKKYAAQATNEGGAASYTIQVECVVAYAAEDLDNSGGGTTARIKVHAK